MAHVINEIGIEGPIDQVFDIVTTTRYWTRWHPATIGVDGPIDRPVTLGDLIHETARIGARVYEGNWQVAELDRPTHVVLRGENGRISITYTFTTHGSVTQFRRELQFEPEDFRESVPDPARLQHLMYQKSDQALRTLSVLVEELLSARIEQEFFTH